MTRRRSQEPEFFMVPRRALRDPRLNPTQAIALSAALYRSNRGRTLSQAELTKWCGWDRTTSWRALRHLQELNLVTDDGQVDLDQLAPGPENFLKVQVDEVRQHGSLDALALGQLRSWPLLKSVRRKGALAEVRSAMFGKMLGICRKTVAAVLARLERGDTVGYRRAVRAGQKAVARAYVALQRVRGAATNMRLLAEREQKTQAARSLGKAPSRVAYEAHVPTASELAQMLHRPPARAPSPTPA